MYIDFLDDIHNRSDDRAVLPRVNPYENYDEKKFRERFRLLKRVVLHLLSDVATPSVRTAIPTVYFLLLDAVTQVLFFCV